jgi:hypothetical protein
LCTFSVESVGSLTDRRGAGSENPSHRGKEKKSRGSGGGVVGEFSGQAYDPETLAILEAAFDEAWALLKINSDELVTREALARCLLVLASSGERDRVRLRNGALLELSAAYKRPEEEGSP